MKFHSRSHKSELLFQPISDTKEPSKCSKPTINPPPVILMPFPTTSTYNLILITQTLGTIQLRARVLQLAYDAVHLILNIEVLTHVCTQHYIFYGFTHFLHLII